MVPGLPDLSGKFRCVFVPTFESTCNIYYYFYLLLTSNVHYWRVVIYRHCGRDHSETRHVVIANKSSIDGGVVVSWPFLYIKKNY